ncbi:MAG: hypothetical protein AB7H86_13380 [Blastocatellales bacterium]
MKKAKKIEKVVRRGRPELPKGEALAKVTPIRFQVAEKAQYEKAAEAEGITLSEWVRKTLNAAVGG